MGYGSPLFNNSGCTTEGFPTSGAANPVFPPGATPASPASSGTCNGDIHQIVEGTVGFWHKIYNGSKGRVQWGIQYSYLTKVAWSGDNTRLAGGPPPVVTTGPSVRPKAVDNMVWTSLRYYLP